MGLTEWQTKRNTADTVAAIWHLAEAQRRTNVLLAILIKNLCPQDAAAQKLVWDEYLNPNAGQQRR